MRTRLISAVILLPAVIGLIVLGGVPYFVAVVVVMSLAAFEFNRLMQRGGHRPPLWVALVLVVALMLDVAAPQLNEWRPAISFILIGSLTWQLWHRQGQPVSDWALAVTSGLYLGVAGEHFVLLRLLPEGERWLLLTLVGTWLADSGAYFVGSRFGRHKMTPALSPRKSWEGLAGGVIVGPVLNAGVASLFGLPLSAGAMLGLIGATVGTLGDLSISMIKRQVGAKDSGQLIPGHGGALDRLDSLLFTVIVGYYYLIWFMPL